MAKLLMKLKAVCYQYKKDLSKKPYCDLCHDQSLEDAEHIIVHCVVDRNSLTDIY